MTDNANLSPKQNLARKVEVITKTDDLVNAQAALGRKVTQKVQVVVEDQFDKANPCYQIVSKKDVSPEEIVNELADYTTPTGDPEIDAKHTAELNALRDYTTRKMTALDRQLAAATDVDATAVMQSSIFKMRDGLSEFNRKAEPFLQIVDAAYELRINGKASEAFEELKNEKIENAALDKQRSDLDDEIQALLQQIEDIDQEISVLEAEKTMFGMMGPSGASKAKVILLRVKNDTASAQLQKLAEQKAAIKPSFMSALGPDEIAQKKKLGEMLNMSGEEHKNAVQDWVDYSLKFIDESEEETANIRKHLDMQSGNLAKMQKEGGRIVEVQATINDALGIALTRGADMTKGLTEKTEREGSIAEMQRKKKLQGINDHVEVLTSTLKGSITGYAHTSEAMDKVSTLKKANVAQQDQARNINTQGIGVIASSVSTVLQAVSGAALAEANASALDVINETATSANRINGQTAIQVAWGKKGENAQLVKVLESLNTTGEGIRKARDITASLLPEMLKTVENIKQTAKGVVEDINSSSAVTTEAVLAIHKNFETKIVESTPAPASVSDF